MKLMCNCDEMVVCSSKSSSSMGDDDAPNTPETKKIFSGFALGVAFSATIGGNGFLLASMANIVLKGYFDERYPASGFNFLTYMMFSMPISLIMLILAWVVLCYLWLPRRCWFSLKKKSQSEAALKSDLDFSFENIIKERYDKLEPMGFDEIQFFIFDLESICFFYNIYIYIFKLGRVVIGSIFYTASVSLVDERFVFHEGLGRLISRKVNFMFIFLG